MEEEAFISCLFNKPDLLPFVNKIKVDHFSNQLCGKIYKEFLSGNFSLPIIAKKVGSNLDDIIEIQQMISIPNKTLINGYAYYIFEQYKKNKIKNILSESVVDINAIEQVQKETYFEEKPINESDEYLKNAEQRFRGEKDERNIPTGFYNIDEKIGGFRKSEAIFIGGRPGSGKGLPFDAKLLTPKGWIENKDVKVGDVLIGRNGKPTNVIGVFRQPLKDCYNITFKDGRSVICDCSHLWKVYCSKWKNRERVISTEELYNKLQCKRYQRRISIPKFSGVYGEEKDFIIPPYIIGVLIGDGCLTTGLYYNKPSKKVLEKVKKYVPPYVKVTERKGNNIGLTNWVEASRYIKDIGLNVRSYEKFIPQEYFHSSYEQRRLLFEGLMDTDGYYDNIGYEYSTTSERLKNDVMQLAYSLGYNCSCSQRIGKYSKLGKVVETRMNFRVHISSKNPLTIDKIEKVESVPTQCIAVDNEEKLFVTDNYIVTHNTTFGINVAYNMAKEGNNVLFCSIEMSAIELHERLVRHITELYDYRHMSQDDFEKIIRTSKYVKEKLPLVIYDKPGMTIEDIVYKSKESKAGVVFIDHLAILKSSKSFKSRYEEVSYLSARIKQLARELDVPVICLCQLNRNLESREIKAPTMADIRDSGSVEQDGDIIGFVYRPEYHLKEREPDNKNSKEYTKWLEDLEAVKGKAQLIIAKNRRGITDRFSFRFDGKTFSFYEL